MMESVPTSTSSTSSVTSSDGRNGAIGGSEFLNLGMFGQSSGSGELLLGTSGFGGGLGNGYGSDFGLGSSVKTSAFDLNDFPSLGGGVAGTVGPSTPGNGLAAALRQQQQLLAHQQMLQSGSSGSKSPNLYRLAMSSGPNAVANFNMATEDFPALPGAPPSGGGGNSGSGTEPGGPPLSPGGNTGFVTSMSRISSSGASGSGLYGFDLDGGSNQLEGAGLLGGLGGLSALSSGSNPSSTLGHQRSSTPSSTSVGNVGSSAAPGPGPGSSGGGSTLGSTLSGDYGLLGLLGVIRMTDADRNALALGSDLTLLGLNLNSNDQLYSTFASPWSENPATKEPHYQLPMCYYMQPPALKTGHLSKFQLETLFYIFYALPKDVLQAYSAQELYSREWRYNADVKTWFKRATAADGIANLSGSNPQYLYFDVNSWERRLFNGNIQNITNGFLSEEDVRVKFPSS